ncbi:hypothetical protein FGO68_gene16569 [Halteria grandinella]|uniref:Uncharacterized protein n=1 Tax=Halteria grandinella TaxID=5974 RepID=A0A8J8NNW2_HALGN|nr:hypothetical protein FGO68_gene16569 [Halteria grandinella]
MEIFTLILLFIVQNTEPSIQVYNECQVSTHIAKASENLLEKVVIIVLWNNQRNELNYEEEKGQYGTLVKRIVSLLELSVICVSLFLFTPHKCQRHSDEVDQDDQAKEHENQLHIIEKGQFQS